MDVETSPQVVRNAVRSQQRDGAVVGVVPTMGALHAGHVSLMKVARDECDFVVATIFVNPTQFAPGEDFDKYPRTLEQDLQQCESAGVDLVFAPQAEAMYDGDAQTITRVMQLTTVLEGAARPDHFDGVTTIVAKLFNITLPNRAYFGQKDYQQQLIIRRMVEDLDWDIQVVTCPIVREADGLAMSSRNRYLSVAERDQALALSRALNNAERLASDGFTPAATAAETVNFLSSCDGLQLEYAVAADTKTLNPADENASSAVILLAARVGTTRLIDNRILQFRPGS